MTWLRALRRRLFPPTDGAICAELNPRRCEWHLLCDGPCRCLEPPHHGGLHECGQGARWADLLKTVRRGAVA